MNTKVKGRRYYYLLRSTGVRLRLWPNGLLVPLVCFCAEVSGAQLIAWSAHFESIYLYFLDRAKGTRTILAWVAFINSSESGGCIDIYVTNSLFKKKLLKIILFIFLKWEKWSYTYCTEEQKKHENTVTRWTINSFSLKTKNKINYYYYCWIDGAWGRDFGKHIIFS